jgi:hypothetical protein
MIPEENIDEQFTEIDRNPKQIFEECPNCALDENRWVYECSTCEFIGCYDTVHDNGCYMGDADERACPECGGTERVRFGKIGVGSIDGS